MQIKGRQAERGKIRFLLRRHFFNDFLIWSRIEH